MRILISKSELDSQYNKYNQLLTQPCYFCNHPATILVKYDSDVFDQPKSVVACSDKHFVTKEVK